MHGGRAVHAQTICTRPLVPKFSRCCKWQRVCIWAETYAIAYPIHLTMNTPWFLSLVRLQHVREVADLFDVGTSSLKKCLSYTYKAQRTDLTKQAPVICGHGHTGMHIARARTCQLIDQGSSDSEDHSKPSGVDLKLIEHSNWHARKSHHLQFWSTATH